MQVNSNQKLSIIHKMEEYYGEEISEKKVGIWGLAFKPETDDVREAPSLYIIKSLLDLGVDVVAYDPEATENFKIAIGTETASKITFVDNMTDAIENVDALVICTEWNEFRRPDFSIFKDKMKTSVIFDGRNLYDLKKAEEEKITYISVGRPYVNAHVKEKSVDA